MPDETYQPDVYRKQGGNELVVASGGKITVESGGEVAIAALGGLTLPAGEVAHADLDEGVEQSVDITVTSAELLALNATPIEVVAAPGADKAVVFEGAVIHKPAGTAYGGIAAGEDLSFKYTDGSGLEVGVCETTGFLDQTTAQTRVVRPQTGALSAGTVSSFTPVANAAMVLHLLVGEITTGDSDLLLRVYYRVVPTVLS